ncbi:hypothetical protein [Bradyrhizobium shewense]|uniref:hypothetical protein n=1 Tax=Bradyrhizobium shewense TaxID=1761772 RepID=UPI00101AD1E3|nr:hypothetical protein [Bradyrhizobium shewense]
MHRIDATPMKANGIDMRDLAGMDSSKGDVKKNSTQLMKQNRNYWSRSMHPAGIRSAISNLKSGCEFVSCIKKRRDATEPRRPDALGRGAESALGSPQHHQYIRDDACGNETTSMAELRLVRSIVEIKDCFRRVH